MYSVSSPDHGACGGSKDASGSAKGDTLKSIKDKGEMKIALEGAYLHITTLIKAMS